MKSLNELKLELQNVEKQLRDIKAHLDKEDREPNEEEEIEIRTLLERAEKLDGYIELETKRVKLENRFQEPEDPEKDKKLKPQPAEQRVSVQGNKLPFETLGEQLQAIAEAGQGQRIDPRLHEVRAAQGLQEAVGADGGFLLQPDFAAGIFEDAFETGLLASRCQQYPTTQNQLIIPGFDETSRAAGSRYGGVRGYWISEASEKTKSSPTYRRVELNLKKCCALVYATDEMLEDAPVLERHVRQAATAEIGFMIDDAIINGSGAGQPLGIMNAGCVVSVSKETGQASSTVLFENITKMWARLFPASQANAVWLINQAVWPELFNMYLAVGTGGAPVFLPAGGISGQQYSTLIGRPIVPVEQCQDLGTSGDIILADFGGYILAHKGGIQTASSIHVRFQYDESVFRFVYRVDGQPFRASALTPYKGSSNTLSHFVKLADR